MAKKRVEGIAGKSKDYANISDPKVTPLPSEAMGIPRGAAPPPPAVTAPTVADPLDAFREALKWDAFAMQGAHDKDPESAFRMLMEDLKKKGADDKSMARLEALGAERVLKSKTLPGDVLVRVKGGNASLTMARSALRGLKGTQFTGTVEKTLKTMKESGEFDDRILDEIRSGVKRIGPEAFTKIPVQQVVRSMAERGEEGRVANLWNRLTKRAPLGKVGEAAATAAKAGPVVAAETTAALKGAGIRGIGKAAGKMGKLGALANIAGVLYTANQARDVFGGGQEQAASQRMVQGLTSAGKPLTSLEYLRSRQEADERLMERKAVLMQHEPGILEELARNLANSRDQGPLTKSEMSVGMMPQKSPNMKPRPTTLLDQLLSELD